MITALTPPNCFLAVTDLITYVQKDNPLILKDTLVANSDVSALVNINGSNWLFSGTFSAAQQIYGGIL